MRLVWKDKSGYFKEAKITLENQAFCLITKTYKAQVMPVGNTFLAIVTDGKWRIDKGFKTETQAKNWASKTLKKEAGV